MVCNNNIQNSENTDLMVSFMLVISYYNSTASKSSNHQCNKKTNPI